MTHSIVFNFKMLECASIMSFYNIISTPYHLSSSLAVRRADDDCSMFWSANHGFPDWPFSSCLPLLNHLPIYLSKVIPVAADVRNPEAIKSAVDEMVTKVGLPHIVINNAAGNFISPTERLSSNAFRTVVDIVLNGTANVTLDVGKRLIAAEQGIYFTAIYNIYNKHIFI